MCLLETHFDFSRHYWTEEVWVVAKATLTLSHGKAAPEWDSRSTMLLVLCHQSIVDRESQRTRSTIIKKHCSSESGQGSHPTLWFLHKCYSNKELASCSGVCSFRICCIPWEWMQEGVTWSRRKEKEGTIWRNTES